MIKIKGVYAASLSVLKQDLSLDIDNTIKHAEDIIHLGCHGAVFFGSTGQSQLISLSENGIFIPMVSADLKNLFVC